MDKRIQSTHLHSETDKKVKIQTNLKLFSFINSSILKQGSSPISGREELKYKFVSKECVN